MLRKAMGATFILLLMTGAVCAQMSPELHLPTDNKPPRTKEQKAYDKAVDQTYQSKLKEISDAKKKSDPWGYIRTSPSSRGQK